MKRSDFLRILYSQGESRRYTQDSVVLPDVWLHYLEEFESGNPNPRVDLLITPFQPPFGRAVTPGELAEELRDRLDQVAAASIAYHQASVAIELTLTELVRAVLPMSRWWFRRVQRDDSRALANETITSDVKLELVQRLARRGAQARGEVTQPTRAKWEDSKKPTLPGDVLVLVQVIGTLALLQERRAQGEPADEPEQLALWPPPSEFSERAVYFEMIVGAAARYLDGAKEYNGEDHAQVYSVSINRPAEATVWMSRQTVKCDAALRLFELDCSKITWAILDVGIEARLPAFRVRENDQLVPLKVSERNRRGDSDDWGPASRVVATYDFTRFRDVVTGHTEHWPEWAKNALQQRNVDETELLRALRGGRLLDWGFWESILRIPHTLSGYRGPENSHGTHVAGILAANWLPGEEDSGDFGPAPEYPLRGICPDIRIYDLRVLDAAGEGAEFNVMAALQFLQYLNSHKGLMVVHGANLSLGIYHDKANYACGATPVCEECTRAVGSGLVVVASAGNDGFEDALGITAREGYRPISIRDPGNAEAVITVGSTHREMPHLYGVSYFSSRGPTGDGRMKPDLLAPGEKIESCLSDGDIQRMDGTSMAAPHVSGAAALLMARNRELLRQPARIKKILCESATNLGRIREFQGCGLVDCLRALQSV